MDIHHRAAQCQRVENVDHDRLDAAAAQFIGVRIGTRRPKYERATLQTQGYEPSADGAGGPGEKNSCRHHVFLSIIL
jgi:hypothetical protein